MTEQILCKRCGQRRARRACPALEADICTICCGTEREVSISCPLDCEYLKEAHRREKALPVEETEAVEPGMELTEEFLQRHKELLLLTAYSLVQAAMRTPGAVDTDALEALEALIKTHRTSQSGLIYETRAENSVAAAVQRAFSESLAGFKKMMGERDAQGEPRDRDVLGILIFLRRFGLQNINGRPRGRMFIDLLRHMTPAELRIDESAPSIIL
jgi:hypothetical protein